MRRLLIPVGLLALALAEPGACFSPLQPACAFSCAVDHLCPTDYTCANDGFCHRNDGKGVCLLADADADAKSNRGAPDTGPSPDGGSGPP
jgi:hypothetical protein